MRCRFDPWVWKITWNRKCLEISMDRGAYSVLQSIGAQRVKCNRGHAHTHTHTHTSPNLHSCILQSSCSMATTVQFSSVAQLCLTLCDPMNRSMSGLPVHHQFPEFTQTHTHQVSDAIKPSHPLSSSSPPAPNPTQHHGLS